MYFATGFNIQHYFLFLFFFTSQKTCKILKLIPKGRNELRKFWYQTLHNTTYKIYLNYKTLIWKLVNKTFIPSSSSLSLYHNTIYYIRQTNKHGIRNRGKETHIRSHVVQHQTLCKEAKMKGGFMESHWFLFVFHSPPSSVFEKHSHTKIYFTYIQADRCDIYSLFIIIIIM